MKAATTLAQAPAAGPRARWRRQPGAAAAATGGRRRGRGLAPALAAALAVTVASAALAGTAPLRPEVARPLSQAGELLRAGKAEAALAKVRAADAVPDRSAAEQLTIERMRGAAAQRAGAHATAARAFSYVFEHGQPDRAEQAQLAEAIAYAYAQLQDTAQARAWVAKAVAAGGSGADLQQLQAYLQAAAGDYAAIARDAAAAVVAAERAGGKPAEAELLRLADAQRRSASPAYPATLAKLLADYPKPVYWVAYLDQLPRSRGFSDRYALDLLRLKLASDTLERSDDYLAMTQLALQAGFAGEAAQVVERGFARGALGSGEGAARHERLRRLARDEAAAAAAALPAQAAAAAAAGDGNALVQVGFRYVTIGEVDRGLALIDQGIARGGLKQPAQARLWLGIAQLRSPGARSKAAATLRGVPGTDGGAALARAWLLLAGD